MRRLNILSPGFATPNGAAFLFPLIVHRRLLHDCGIDVRLHKAVSPGLTDCDTLMVDSKYHRNFWKTGSERVVDEFSSWSGKCNVVYCDTTDSSGSLQVELLPAVSKYAKSQLLADKNAYMTPMYGHRAFSDYYHRQNSVVDANPDHSKPVEDIALLGKLCVHWNSGLADYSLYGPLRAALYRRLPVSMLLRYPRIKRRLGRSRLKAISCRFGTVYTRETVAYQRKKIRELLGDRIETDKISRREYYRELEDSKIVVSPFGWGEITLKDFEVFLTGGALLKPDVSHMKTWPEFYVPGETVFSHNWDLSDLEEVIENALAGETYLEVARNGQETYERYTSGPEAGQLFVDQLKSMIE